MKRFLFGLGLIFTTLLIPLCLAGDETGLSKAEQRKEEAKMKVEEKKLHHEFEKEHERKTRKMDKARNEEARKIKRLEKEQRARDKNERSRLACQRSKEERRQLNLKERERDEVKATEKRETRDENNRLLENWSDVRKSEVENEYKEGKYADLYMIPAWPFSSWFFHHKAMFNVRASYWYATDAYGSDGASRNLTTLAFGEQRIQLQDILLASKLLGEKIVNLSSASSSSSRVTNCLYGPLNCNGSTNQGSSSGSSSSCSGPSNLDLFMQHFYDNVISFCGHTEKYSLEFDFARHVLRDDITIGIQVPVLYIKNHLRDVMDFPTNVASANNATCHVIHENVELVYKEALRNILRAKGITQLGGSAAGLGDITLFGNAEITTKYIDKIVVGLKVVVPTGKDESMSKLWSPSLNSNGHCAEFAAFASFLVNYKSYLNPHLFLQASVFSTAHVSRRIPYIVSSPEDAVGGLVVGNDLMAMGDRIEYSLPNATPFSDWDSTIPGFADHPVSVKFEKGPEFHVRLGNVFEKFIYRRGFLDIYYDLRAKLKDDYRSRGLVGYAVKVMEDNTESIEHRIGFEFTHQCDSTTHLKATLNYSFAGTNAPKAFDVGLSLGHSF